MARLVYFIYRHACCARYSESLSLTNAGNQSITGGSEERKGSISMVLIAVVLKTI